MTGLTALSELKSLTNGNPAIKIAVLDGPVDLNHPCFKSSIVNPSSPAHQNVQASASVNMALAHGTAVYSLIFGKPGTSVEGVAPDCSGLIIPIYSPSENGGFTAASQVHLAKSIRTAIDQGANIINISGGQFSRYGEPEFLLKQAIDDCYKAGVLIVAAAGNEGCNCLHVPASDRQVLAVGSMDENGNPTPETNFGGHYQFNGILAPGKDLTAAQAGGTTFKTNGATSYATPIVSGIVGLLMSLQLKKGRPDAYAIKSILEDTAVPCNTDAGIDCKRFLKGKLNLSAAIAAITRNPGIRSSDYAFNERKKIISMSQPSIPQTNEVSINFPAPEEVLPSDNSTEKNGEVQQPVIETSIHRENTDTHDENMLMAASGGESDIQETETTTKPALALSRDGPSINPSEKETEIFPDKKSNLIVKNLNMKKMENNTKNQNAEVQGTSDCVIPGQAAVLSGEVNPSDCGCGGNKPAADNGNGGNGNGNGGGSSLVYALGHLGYDFGSEAHQDSFTQSMGGNSNDPGAMIKYLKANPWAAEELTWTLNIDATPIYALYPAGSHSQHGYERIRQYFEQQQNGNIQRISVPGITQGSTPLLMGHTVSNLIPNLRGMYSWTTEALTAAATGAKGSAKALAENVSNFLNRIYYQMRNLGVSPSERALNYAATNAYQVSQVFAAALKENLELNDIAAEKSPICRPGSDCYDVTLSFFNPKERLTVARKEYRFTIDVSDVVPVTVGEVRAWSVY